MCYIYDIFIWNEIDRSTIFLNFCITCFYHSMHRSMVIVTLFIIVLLLFSIFLKDVACKNQTLIAYRMKKVNIVYMFLNGCYRILK